MSNSQLKTIALEAKEWLFEAALPVWYAHNLDRDGWGFSERLNQDLTQTRDPRRINVQARQIYVFCEAKNLGWTGDWRAPVEHGLQALERYKRPDGLYRFKLDADGKIFDDHAEVYGQAFVLYAFAHAGIALDDQERMSAHAHRLVDTLYRARKHPKIGFEETTPSTLPLRSNPHMHLFEACQKWLEIEKAGVWQTLADEIASLAVDHFIDPTSGQLCEHFDQDWQAMADHDGLLVEPGHQFEWAWLLHNFGKSQQRADYLQVAKRLHRKGLDGVNLELGVPYMSWTLGKGPRPNNARLWPSTEWLKSALAQGKDDEAIQAWHGLKRYLETPIPGLWYDQMRADGTIVEEPAPASTFYHIVCAIAELCKTVQDARS